jgi:peptidoglycan/LPS O-acetylase OafA/YrhL
MAPWTHLLSTQDERPSVNYRPEIDGLRAIAVLSVLIYHAGYDWLPGGWLGVDIFFVISGFLITQIILRDLSAGTFSLSGFYARRARRILPALTVVTLTTMTIAPLFMWAWQIAELGQSALAASVFVANLLFDSQYDYFRSDTAQLPLIHMWSLSIEEQYYAIFPLLMLALWSVGLRARAIFVVLGAICLLSIMFAFLVAKDDPSYAFYMLECRIYEIGIGSLTAVLASRNLALRGAAARVSIVVALGVIAASFFFVSETGGSPASRLAVLVGTAVVLFSETARGVGYAFLTRPILRFFGLISFSLYLWHQPILAFSRLHWDEPPALILPALLTFSVLLAVLSCRYVEVPFRRMKTKGPLVLIMAAAAMISMASVGYFYATQASRITQTKFKDPDLSISITDRLSYMKDGFYTKGAVGYSTHPAENVLLIGDSFAQDFFNMAMEVGAFQESELVTRRIDFDCQPYFGKDDISRFIPEYISDRCAEDRARLVASDLLEHAETIIIASNYKKWMIDRLESSVSQMRAMTDAQIIIIGPKNFGSDISTNLMAYLPLTIQERSQQRVKLAQVHLKRDAEIRAAANDLQVDYIDTHANICGAGSEACPLFTPQGHLFSFNGSNLTKRGAAYAGALIFALPPLRRFAPLEVWRPMSEQGDPH